MFAGSIITMIMIQHHFCLLIMNQKLIKFSNMSKLALLLRTICNTDIQAKTMLISSFDKTIHTCKVVGIVQVGK